MHRTGFTLVEVLLYTAVAGVVAVAAFQVLQFLDAAQARATARTSVDAEAVFFVDALREILRSETATAPEPQESGGALIVSGGAQVSVVDGRAVVVRAGESAYLTSARVAVGDLQFRNLATSGSPDIISVAFTMTASPADAFAGGASYSHEYRTTIGTR